ncbi:hypothetical protein [Candidatus Poriferisodalis sp.]|uniref:hypothetical protein n=1 Tax=Candidatus Poriferisodalis sp. TaxID=3101277 RepID=UPI003B52CF99
MAESNEITPKSELGHRRPERGRLLAVLLAALLAAVVAISFTASSASAQTENTDGGTDEQQADDGSNDDGSGEDDSDSTCDHDGSHHGGKHWRLGMSDTLTEVLGIDTETLRTKLQEGSSLADIAAEQEVEVSDVVDALVTAISERAAERDREIDADELTTRITAFVNGERPERPKGEDGRRGRRGLHRGGIDGLGRWGGHAHSDTAA